MTVGIDGLSGNAGCVLDLRGTLAGDLAEQQVPVIVNTFGWSFGTGVNAFNIVYADTTTLTDGSNTTLDLFASGSLLDIFGRALTLAAIKLLYVKNNSTDSALLMGGGVATDLDIWAATSDITIVQPGGIFLWIDPSASGVVTSTNKNLKLEDDGAGAVGNKLIDVIALGLD